MSSSPNESNPHSVRSGFASKYQNLFEKLLNIRLSKPTIGEPSDASKSALLAEIREASEDVPALKAAISELFGPHSPSPTELLDFSVSAYRDLDLAESQVLLGGLWACAAEVWLSAERTSFLSLLSRDPHEVFQMLNIATFMFQRARFSSAELLAWVSNAYPRVRNDEYQSGFWRCLDAFCTSNPAEALIALESSLNPLGEAFPLEITPHMLQSIRSTSSGIPDIVSHLQRVEEKFKAPGNPSWRALYLQSWAHMDQPLGEIKALQLRDDCYRPGTEEETAWCFLLSTIIQTDRASWTWAYRELLRAEGNGLLNESRRWVLVAAIHGFKTADKDDSVQIGAWSQLLSILLPVPSEHRLIWRQVEDELTHLATRDYRLMIQLIETIADKSGRTWLQFLNGDSNKNFYRIFSNKQLAQATSTHLCFGSNASVRHLVL